jgi:AcrR family transcriptional regulator
MPRKSERTRQRIIQAANRLFYRRGYNRTSFTDIVDAAGVPRGNIYYYFRTKEEILRAALGYRLEIIDTMMDEWDRNFPDPGGRLKRFVQVMVNSRETTAQYGCPMGTLNAELAKDQRDLQAQALVMFQRLAAYLATQFASLGFEAGRAAALARELLARAQGVNMIAHVFAAPDYLLEQQETLNRWIEAHIAASREREGANAQK